MLRKNAFLWGKKVLHLPSFIRLRSLLPFYWGKIAPGPRQTKMDHGRSKGELSPRSLGTGGDVRMNKVTWNAKSFKTKCYNFCLRASCHSLVVHLQKSLIDYYFLPLSACHFLISWEYLRCTWLPSSFMWAAFKLVMLTWSEKWYLQPFWSDCGTRINMLGLLLASSQRPLQRKKAGSSPRYCQLHLESAALSSFLFLAFLKVVEGCYNW